MKNFQPIANILVIVGAINWGLFGLFNLDLINVLFGGMAGLAKVVYILIGLSGLLVLLGKGKK